MEALRIESRNYGMTKILPNHPELKLAVEAARLGGNALMHVLREGTEVREKGLTNDLVTNADLEAERVITELIRRERPEHQFLAEEGHNNIAQQATAEHLWIIDPLDGTTNFAHGIPHFAVSIAYYENGIPQCGVVLNPARQETYLAVRGAGAWFQDAPITVGEETQLSNVLVGVGFYYDRGEMMRATLATIEALFEQQIRGIRRFGTASLDLCQVARGMYGAFFEYQLSPWDFAAGRLIVEEAGGRVTTACGKPIPIDKTTVLASNSKLHETMLNTIGRTASTVLG